MDRRGGGREESIRANLISSGGRYERTSLPAGLVRSVYADVLLRQASQAEVAAWLRGFTAGTVTPDQFVSALVNSPEARGLFVGEQFRTLLGREPDPGTVASLSNYSSREELATIVDRTTRGERIETRQIMDGDEIIKWQHLIREVILAPHVQDYIVRLTLATHPNGAFAPPITNQYLRWGASPRGAQTIALAAKVRALLEGRYNVSFEDIRRVYLPAMRHRVILNFEAQAEGVDPDNVLLKVLEAVPEKAEG